MKYKHILALDPSGNFNEGKGTTGWVLMNYKETLIARGSILAENYQCAEHYWDAHKELIEYNYDKYGDDLIVVVEDYVLYRDRSANQTNSKMETCRLLGVILWTCWYYKIPYSLQLAASVKHRWSDELLERERILYKHRGKYVHTESGLSMDVIHTRDAFRHAIHYAVCRNQTEKKPIHKQSKGAFNGRRSNY